jgi:hypothetical protein
LQFSGTKFKIRSFRELSLNFTVFREPIRHGKLRQLPDAEPRRQRAEVRRRVQRHVREEQGQGRQDVPQQGSIR